MWNNQPMRTVEECCAPVLAEPLAEPEAGMLAEWFGVLSDPTRLRLLSLIAAAGEAWPSCWGSRWPAGRSPRSPLCCMF